MSEKMKVKAIKRGTVIDHITPGQGLKILNRLHLINDKIRVTVGLNLPSNQMGSKDIIKVEDWLFSMDEANELALLAPDATVNIIEDHKVASKIKVELPDELTGIFPCPNANCVSHSEPVESCFSIHSEQDGVFMRCCYCELLFRKEHFVDTP